MVMDQQQQPIVRDFLGLGKLVTDDQGLEEGASGKPSFLPIRALHTPLTNMDFRGVMHPVCNIGHSMELNFPFKKTSEEMHVEGSAESYGMATARQWQGIVPGTSTNIGGPPARLVAPDAYVKSNGMPLTIFYGGQVNVYNVNTDKAQAIMNMAGNGSLLSSNGLPLPLGVPLVLGAQGFCPPAGVAENFCFNVQAGPIQYAADQVSQNCPAASKHFDGGMPNTPSSASSPPQPAVPKALPLARKASLARFLEKRKERMQMMMPYFKKQFPPAQGLPTGDQMLGPFHGATLAKLYEEYYRRPSTMLFGMPEHMAPHNDVSSCGVPAKE